MSRGIKLVRALYLSAALSCCIFGLLACGKSKPKTPEQQAVDAALRYVIEGKDPVPEYKETADALVGRAMAQPPSVDLLIEAYCIWLWDAERLSQNRMPAEELAEELAECRIDDDIAPMRSLGAAGLAKYVRTTVLATEKLEQCKLGAFEGGTGVEERWDFSSVIFHDAYLSPTSRTRRNPDRCVALGLELLDCFTALDCAQLRAAQGPAAAPGCEEQATTVRSTCGKGFM